MADDTTLLVCDKCGAKLRVRTGLIKVMKTVKCSRCGTAVPTTPKPGAAPAAGDPAPASPPTPPPAPASTPEPAAAPAPIAAPAPVAAPPPPPAAEPPAPPAPPAAPHPVAPTPHVPTRAHTPHAPAEAVPVPVVSAAHLAGGAATSGPPTTVADELRRARGRIQELELRVGSLLEQGAMMTEARTRIAKLESELAEATKPDAERLRLRREVEEQGERITELQQLWMSKEKEAREAAERAERAEDAQRRLRASVEDMLHTYHANEAAAAQQRLQELQTRVQALLDAAAPP